MALYRKSEMFPWRAVGEAGNIEASTVEIFSPSYEHCCCCVLRHFLTSLVIRVASDIEGEKCDKFCSEALISAWGSFTCRKSTTRNPRLYFPSEGSHTQDFYALKKNPSNPAGIEPVNLGSRGEYNNHWTTGVDLLRTWFYSGPAWKLRHNL